MNKSESIKEIATALNKAQAEMSGAQKKSANPFFKSKYANLEEIINCVKTPFANNGLSYMQWPIASDGYAGVETIIMHISGEWISSELSLKCSKNDPQGMGSAITYARRYSLQSAAGVPSEDDDGNGATRPMQQPSYIIPQNNQEARQVEPRRQLVNKQQSDELTNLARTKKLTVAQVNPIFSAYGINKFEQVAADKFIEIKNKLGAM